MKHSDRNDLKEVLVVTTTLTCQQVLKFGGDAFTLYMFYVYTSCWQDNARPKATDTFCMTGLGWGKDRFYHAKKILDENNYIKKHCERDDKGRIKATYISIQYRINTTDIGRVGLPEGGFQETNTLKEIEIPLKKINTKKSTFGEFEKVLLTDEEYQKLIEKMGEKNTLLMIAELDTGIASKGYKYKSHYAAILNWARRKITDHNSIKNNIAF